MLVVHVTKRVSMLRSMNRDRDLDIAALRAQKDHFEKRVHAACEERLRRCMAELKNTAQTLPQQEFLFFNVPHFLHIDPPQLSRERCLKYVIEQMRARGFTVQRCKDERLFISWDTWDEKTSSSSPKTEKIEKSERGSERKRKRKLGVPYNANPVSDDEDEADDVITYQPNSQFGDLFLRSQLMARNPKYSHHFRN